MLGAASRHPAQESAHARSLLSRQPRLLALCSAGGAQAFTLDILHFNDFHSRIESINAFDSTCSAEDETAGKCFGGAARLVHRDQRRCATQHRRPRAATSLVLEAGDVFQGSLFFTTYGGAAEAEMLNGIGLDAMVYGNHEFDLGSRAAREVHRRREVPGALRQRRHLGRQPPRSRAREATSSSTSAASKVAIVGVVTPDTAEIASAGDKADVFRDPVAYLTAEVAALQAERHRQDRPRLSHLGVNEDIRVADERARASTRSSAATPTRSSRTPIPRRPTSTR